MAVLRPSALTDAELSRLRHVADDPGLADQARAGALFAASAAMEARGQEAEGFDLLVAANALKHRTLSEGPAEHRPDTVAREHQQSIDRVRALFTAEFLDAHAGEGDDGARPIFIVGMPRSGSTLIEQILSSHHGVQGLGESPALTEALDRPRAYEPDQPRDFRQLAQDYLANLRARGWRPGARPVDKTLESFLHVGMIHLMFPRAVILHSVRDPIDTCLACFRQLFGPGNETLYDLGQIGAEYVGYRAVMDHWRAVLPGRVIDVSHEALVEDPQAQIRWLVTEACGLDWDPACLGFHRTKRPVRTASVAQVRQPIFTTSLQRWRRYEQHLGPLFEALGPYAP
jgi:hypothetical protein